MRFQTRSIIRAIESVDADAGDVEPDHLKLIDLRHPLGFDRVDGNPRVLGEVRR